MEPDIWLVIPCAGTGRRMQRSKPKQYLPLLDSTLIDVTLQRFITRKDIKGIVVAVSDQAEFITYSRFHKHVHIVAGGAERHHSVNNALTFLNSIAKPADLVAVHDAARPCIRQSLLDRLFAQAKSSQSGVILAEPCGQTVKKVNKDGMISETLDRSELFLAQTPQVFRLEALSEALNHVIQANLAITDDASALEAMGVSPEVLQSTSENLKITYPEDISLAEHILQKITEEND